MKSLLHTWVAVLERISVRKRLPACPVLDRCAVRLEIMVHETCRGAVAAVLHIELNAVANQKSYAVASGEDSLAVFRILQDEVFAI